MALDLESLRNRRTGRCQNAVSDSENALSWQSAIAIEEEQRGGDAVLQGTACDARRPREDCSGCEQGFPSNPKQDCRPGNSRGRGPAASRARRARYRATFCWVIRGICFAAEPTCSRSPCFSELTLSVL